MCPRWESNRNQTYSADRRQRYSPTRSVRMAIAQKCDAKKKKRPNNFQYCEFHNRVNMVTVTRPVIKLVVVSVAVTIVLGTTPKYSAPIVVSQFKPL